jgi:RNA polymerase sigma factor (sigma-70 family)
MGKRRNDIRVIVRDGGPIDEQALRQWARNCVRAVLDTYYAEQRAAADPPAASHERELPRGIIAKGPALPLSAPEDAVTAAIERVLAMMPPRRRIVAELRLRHQRTTEDIASILGISPEAVERHVRRVTRDVRSALKAC